jgi:hypothetical protein
VLEPPQKVVRSAIFYTRALDVGEVPMGSSESTCALPCCKLSMDYSNLANGWTLLATAGSFLAAGSFFR